MLLIHAGVTDRRSWAGLVDVLGPSVRSIRYDARGFGETTTEPHDDWSPVEDARAVLDAAAADAAIIVACSMGGRTAIDLALVAPGRVRALVLIAPAISGAPAPELDDVTAELDRRGDAAIEQGDLAELNRIEAELWLDGPGRAGRVGKEARELFLAMNGAALAADDPGARAQDAVAWPRSARSASRRSCSWARWISRTSARRHAMQPRRSPAPRSSSSRTRRISPPRAARRRALRDRRVRAPSRGGLTAGLTRRIRNSRKHPSAAGTARRRMGP